MKRTVAVCLMAGLVLAMSTAAFATPLSAWDVTYTSTPSSITNNTSTYPGGGTMTWFQPYAGYLNPADAAYAGGTLTQTITSATLTIKSIGDHNSDVLSIQGTSGWETLGKLTYTGSFNTELTTVYGWPMGANYSYNLTGATGIDWLKNQTGFNANVQLGAGDYYDKVNSSTLVVTAHYTWTADTPLPPPTSPTIPAPGAILLASMGAGLVSWLRARKSL